MNLPSIFDNAGNIRSECEYAFKNGIGYVIEAGGFAIIDNVVYRYDDGWNVVDGDDPDNKRLLNALKNREKDISEETIFNAYGPSFQGRSSVVKGNMLLPWKWWYPAIFRDLRLLKAWFRHNKAAQSIIFCLDKRPICKIDRSDLDGGLK